MKITNKNTLTVKFNNPLKSLVLIIVLLTITIFASAVVIYGGAKFTVMFAGALVGFFLLFLPPQWLLCMLIVYAFLILGPLNSLLGIDTHWIPYFLAIGILFQVILYQISNKKEINKTQQNIPTYLWSFMAFSLIAIFSTTSNWPNTYLLINSLRSYFVLWSIYFVFVSYSEFTPHFFRNLWIFFVAAGFLQFPIVVYQRLFVASSRSDSAFWDSVIGTYPGTNISGDSGGMAFFLISIAAIAASLWRFGKLKGKHALLIILFLISPLLFAEVKISYFLIPIMAALIFRAQIKKNPFKYILVMFIAFTLIFGVFLSGKYFNYGESGLGKSFDIEREYAAIFAFSLDKDAYDGSSNMGRMTLINFWWEKNNTEPFRLTLGHGLGSSGFSNTYNKSGSEGWKYRPLHISHTAAAALLWETGILGLLAYICIHIFSAIRAAKLSKNVAIPAFHRAMLFAISVIIISKIIYIPYQNNSSTTQVFFFLLLGMVGFWDKKLNVDNRNAPRN